MTSRLPLVFGMAGLIGSVSLVALDAQAQQLPAPPAPPAAAAPPNAAQPTPDRRDDRPVPRFSQADRAAFFDARLAGLHAGLQLTPDQEKMWPSVETAIRDAAKTMMQMREARRSEAAPSNPVERLQRMSERQISRGEAFKKVADAAGPLYATLNDEQKHRIPMLLRPFGGMRHEHMAMMEHRWRDGGDREQHGGWRRWGGPPMGDGSRGWDRGERGGGGRGWGNE